MNYCSRCLGPLMEPDGTLTEKHDLRYGHFGKTLCAMTIAERKAVVSLQLEGGRL